MESESDSPAPAHLRDETPGPLQEPSPARVRDVARLARVSTATVSRALSQPDRVTKDTREAVMAAVAATGYRVNHAARSLRQQRAGMVVALVPNLANPFFSRILAGMGEALGEAGTGLIVADTQGAQGSTTARDAVLNGTRSDGVVLLDGRIMAGLAPPGPGQPVLVTACEWLDEGGLPAVIVDNADGARQAVAHLAGLGHRHVALLMGPEGNVLTRERLAGAEAAAAAAGVALTRLPGDFSLAAGVEAARAILALPRPARPTAVFAFSDYMACGFMAEVQRGGLRVPGDLSVIGFDDIDLAPHLLPALTTIHQPRDTIGRRAAETVLAFSRDPQAAAAMPMRQILAVRLVERASTGPAPARGGG